jgi:hypothetical protein
MKHSDILYARVFVAYRIDGGRLILAFIPQFPRESSHMTTAMPHASDSHDHASVRVLHDFLTHWREDDDLALELATSEQHPSSTPDEDASSSNADNTRSVRKPRRNRYAEVAQLHEQVRVLEDELVAAREQWKRKSSSAARHRAIVSRNGARGEVTWNQIASREKKLLCRSKRATHDLRDNIHKNRNAVKDARRLLGKTRRLAIAASMVRYPVMPHGMLQWSHFVFTYVQSRFSKVHCHVFLVCIPTTFSRVAARSFRRSFMT